jgi:hypothetical protein
MDGSQIRKIGRESRQQVIKWLDGWQPLPEDEAGATRSCKRCGPNGDNGRRTYRAWSLGALRFPSQAWSLEAMGTAYQNAEQNVRVDGAPRLTAFRRRRGARCATSEFIFWRKFWMYVNGTAGTVDVVDMRRANLSIRG